MTPSTPMMKPMRWVAYLPLVLLPVLAAAAIEGPFLRAALTQEVTASLAAAGQGWAKVSVRGRDVAIQGTPPRRPEAEAARAVAAAVPGVRHVSIRGAAAVTWLADALTFTGTLYLLRFHWVWMLVAAGLGAWVGWRTAGETAPDSPPEDAA